MMLVILGKRPHDSTKGRLLVSLLCWSLAEGDKVHAGLVPESDGSSIHAFAE